MSILGIIAIGLGSYHAFKRGALSGIGLAIAGVWLIHFS